MSQNDEAIDQIGNRRTVRSLENPASTAFRSPSSMVAIIMFSEIQQPADATRPYPSRRASTIATVRFERFAAGPSFCEPGCPARSG